MEVYKFVQSDNGDILLEKITIDIARYNIINKENGDKLLKKITDINIVDVKELKDYNFKKSEIIECMINDKKLNKLKFKSVLGEIYKTIDDGTKIIKNTKLNIKTIKKEDEGFYYLDNIGISVQGVDSNKCLLEIIDQCACHKIKLCIKIKLVSNIIINLSI